MKPLNRPMFRMGGPIKEGIMDGIEEPRRAYQDGAFGTSAYTKQDYDDFIKRMFVTPPPSETTIPGILRPDVKNFYQDGTVTDQYSYENLFKPGQSIFSSDIFDYAKAGIKGDLSNRLFTGGKKGFSTALKKDILSKLPKVDTPQGGGAAFSEEEIIEGDIEDNPTYIAKMQEGSLRRGVPGSDSEDNKTYITKMQEGMLKRAPTDKKQPEADSELLQKLGYDRAVKRGNYQLIEAIRRGLTEGGVQGALDAAFAAGAQDPYGEAGKIKQAAALKEYEMGLEEKKYQRRRGDKIEDQIKILKEKEKISPTKYADSVRTKDFKFAKNTLKMTDEEALDYANKTTTVSENIFKVTSRSQGGFASPNQLADAIRASGEKVDAVFDKSDQTTIAAYEAKDGQYVVFDQKIFVGYKDPNSDEVLLKPVR
jgi:hypothetical protein